jgi:DnaJ-class molecular chaperone
MAAPIDPDTRTNTPAGRVAASSPDLCGWCFGSGSYLEAMDCDREHVYLPVVCASCAGTGRRPQA